MNPIDAVVHFFDPVAGNRRVRARIAASTAMNYDAASKGRRTYGWKWPSTSADAAGQGAREQIRNLARDMVRNRPLAARAREVVIGKVVGTGIMPSVHAPGASERRKAQIEAAVRAFLMTPQIDTLGESTLPMMQETAMGATFTDGEVLARRRWRDLRFNPGLTLPFQVEMLEADYLDQTVRSNGENPVEDGIEYGPTGRIEAYHLYSEHPGATRPRMLVRKSTRVPAADIIHVRRADRPGQLRGVSWLAPVMMTLGEISDYQEAQILKQRMAALLAGVIETEDGATAPNASPIEELSPGALVKVPTGNTISWTTPPKVDGYGEFMTEATGVIAMGIGITRESLTGNLKGVNFSSGRMGHLVEDRNVQRWQQNIMIAQFCNGIERWMLEAWKLVASLPQVPFTLDWTAPRRPLIDPTKEIPAMIEEIDAGLSSRQRKQRELGYDPEVIRRERVADIQNDTAAKLPPPVTKERPQQVQVQLPEGDS